VDLVGCSSSLLYVIAANDSSEILLFIVFKVSNCKICFLSMIITSVTEYPSHFVPALPHCCQFVHVHFVPLSIFLSTMLHLPLMVMMKGISLYLVCTVMLGYFSECANCISHGNTLSKSMHQNVYALAKTSMHQQTALAKTSYNLEWREYIVIYAAQISVLLSG